MKEEDDASKRGSALCELPNESLCRGIDSSFLELR
jgi:hypothetical protein